MRYNFIFGVLILVSCSSNKSEPDKTKRIKSETNSPVIVKHIYSGTEKFDPSSFFIQLTKKGFKVEFLGKSTFFENPDLLNRYIYKNISQIDTTKIFVSAESNYSIQNFDNLKRILKNHRINRFRLP